MDDAFGHVELVLRSGVGGDEYQGVRGNDEFDRAFAPLGVSGGGVEKRGDGAGRGGEPDGIDPGGDRGRADGDDHRDDHDHHHHLDEGDAALARNRSLTVAA
jgi:hypothetical protein